MSEAVEIPPPPVKPPTPESPKEKPIFKTTIVFGQGPVKAVLLDRELSDEQRQQWTEFRTDPLHSTEPEFRVVEGTAFTGRLDEIQKRIDVTDEEKAQLTEVERQKWQRTGRLALNRWGRQNALSAGALLVAGDTHELILSGGKTSREWMKTSLPPQRLENWPSEAELMRDIIIARFGEAFSKNPKNAGKSIESVIKIEDDSTNTLENLAYTINNNPELLKDDSGIGLLGTDFHIKRIAALSHLFSVNESAGGQLGAQDRLKIRAEGRTTYEKILNHMTDAQNNVDLQERNNQEDHWSKELDTDLAYWLGYFGHVKSPQVIQNVVDLLGQPQWAEQAKTEFAKVGLDFDDIKAQDLTAIEERNPEKYNAFRAALVLHVKEHRNVPGIPPLPKKSG